MCQISSTSAYIVAIEKRKPQILLHFQVWRPAMAPPIGVETKSNADAQLQTIPCPTISKSFLTSIGRLLHDKFRLHDGAKKTENRPLLSDL